MLTECGSEKVGWFGLEGTRQDGGNVAMMVSLQVNWHESSQRFENQTMFQMLRCSSRREKVWRYLYVVQLERKKQVCKSCGRGCVGLLCGGLHASAFSVAEKRQSAAFV
jgi:hypothetical protein